jgi:hypothetical protein
MKRTLSGASIALMMGSLACGGSQQSANSPDSEELLEPGASDGDAADELEAADAAAAAATGGEKEYAWTDPENPRCGHPPTDLGDNKFVCFGGNSCKAVSICKTHLNECACYNSCKGNALWLTKTREECESGGGEVKKELPTG